MIKRVGIYALPEGTDPDKFWEYHKKVHTVDAMRVGGPRLKRYVISRVTKVIKGEQKYFGMAETWWDSEEEMNQAFEVDASIDKASSGKSVRDDFHSQVTNHFLAVMEEYVVKE
ncbi:EthD family reductase [Chloroflexota bacterium]